MVAFLLIAVPVVYGKLGKGVEFFPDVEPDYGQVIVHGRGNLSLEEKDTQVRAVEERVLQTTGLQTVYTRAGEQPRGMDGISEDTIGVIQFEFADWKTRDKAHVIMDRIRAATSDLAGIMVEVTAPKGGPPTGKPVQVQLSAIDPAALPDAARKVTELLAKRPDIRDSMTASRPRHRLEISVDKAEVGNTAPASMFGPRCSWSPTA